VEAYLTDILETRKFLKKNFEGPEVVKALRFRLQTHLADPTLDPLSDQVWAGYQLVPRLLKEPFTLLDAGCMSGFLYHFLKRHFKDFTYTGMDRWEEALIVGREFAPEVGFIKADFLTDSMNYYDYIVCSNIPFRGNECDRAVEKLRAHVLRSLVMIYPNSSVEVFGPTGTQPVIS
jgi:SAM-dependent methyltransferase